VAIKTGVKKETERVVGGKKKNFDLLIQKKDWERQQCFGKKNALIREDIKKNVNPRTPRKTEDEKQKKQSRGGKRAKKKGALKLF